MDDIVKTYSIPVKTLMTIFLENNIDGGSNYAFDGLYSNTDGSYNAAMAGGGWGLTSHLQSVNISSIGSGYADGTYTNIDLEEISGLRAYNSLYSPIKHKADIVVSGGSITSVDIVGKQEYASNADVYTANLGSYSTQFTCSPSNIISAEENTAIEIGRAHV